MRLIILLLLITLVAIASSAKSTESLAEHVRDIENLRDLINPESSSSKKGSKKPRKYKCIVIEEGDDDEVIAGKLSASQNGRSPQMDKNKFVYIEADDERKDMVVTATEAPASVSVAPAPVSSNALRYQQPQHQPQQYQQPQQQPYPQQQQRYHQQTQQPQQLQYPQQQQQQPAQQSSSFLQSQNEFEKVTEEEAAVEYPPLQQQQQHVQQRYQDRLVTLPTPSPSFQSQQAQQQAATHTRPQLKQIHLPKAHSFSASGRNNFPAAQTTTLPPEIANAPRDAQNRPLILAPEHCAQIKHYANMYGVSDVKGWVHNNCSFAQSYLPTASCEEIDILVGSCFRNQLS